MIRVSSGSPIDFVKFLYYLFILVSPLFLWRQYHKNGPCNHPATFMIMCHVIILLQISSQGHQSSMTSSMTSFIKIRPYQYLITGMHSDNQIWHASSSGQGSAIRSNSGSVRVKTDAQARVKILKCSNRPRNLFAHVSGHFEHLMSARAYRRACARTLYTSNNCCFFD